MVIEISLELIPWNYHPLRMEARRNCCALPAMQPGYCSPSGGIASSEFQPRPEPQLVQQPGPEPGPELEPVLEPVLQVLLLRQIPVLDIESEIESENEHLNCIMNNGWFTFMRWRTSSEMRRRSSSWESPRSGRAQSLSSMMISRPSRVTRISKAHKSRPPNCSATESIQDRYFSVMGVCSSMAEPMFVFQLPEIDLRLHFQLYCINRPFYRSIGYWTCFIIYQHHKNTLLILGLIWK